MKVRVAILVVAMAMALGACGAGTDLGALESDLAGLLATAPPGGGGIVATADPSASALPGGGPTAPPAGPSGTIRGVITFKSHGRTEDPISHQAVEHWNTATFDVRLVRDPAAEGEAYIDDGSTYTVDDLIKTEFPGANCVATSETTGKGTYAFASNPTTSYENSIDAQVLRDEGLVLISAIYSWTLNVVGNSCDGRAPTTVETSGALECPFGLMAKLIEGSGSDQIDTACTLPGGESYSGLLTLTH